MHMHDNLMMTIILFVFNYTIFKFYNKNLISLVIHITISAQNNFNAIFKPPVL